MTSGDWLNRTAICALMLGCGLSVGPAQPAGAQENDAAPPNTLPFQPTVPSAPPVNPTYRSPPPPPPPPIDDICLEIAPIIRAGVVASRFASLSPSTAQGAAIGRYMTEPAIEELGPTYCTVTIPAASPITANSPFNQVTCQLDQQQTDTGSLNDFRDYQAALAEQIAACPAMARWQNSPPVPTAASAINAVEDHIFSHPDVAVQLVIRASMRTKAGDWPMSKIRTLSLIFRTPNPNRPPPVEPADMETPRRE